MLRTTQIPSRQQQWQRLKDEPLDVLVIGGGATGCGIAVDAATRGLNVAVVEMGDFASQTSSCSTKLVHGGVRYLESAIKRLDLEQYKLVREGLEERAYLLHNAPHLARRLRLITPIYSWFEAAYLWTGLKLYDWMSGDYSIGSSEWLDKGEVLESIPDISQENLKGGIAYYDGQFNDARMAISLVLTAAERGAITLNYAKALDLIHEQGALVGASIQDVLTRQVIDTKAKVIINATGPMADSIRSMDDSNSESMMQPSKGTHIVINKPLVQGDTGLLIPHTPDKRVLFVLPWQGQCLAGTTDEPADPNTPPQPTEDDISYILNCLSSYFETPIDANDIQAAWSGLRPLVKGKRAKSTAKISRNHVIETSTSNLVTIAGGKWTNYRRMAEDAVDVAITEAELTPQRPCQTHDLIVHGGENYDSTAWQKLQDDYRLPADVAEHLAEAYGSIASQVAEIAQTGFSKRLDPAHPYIEAEVLYAARHEYAERPNDILSRRTRLSFINQKSALKALPRVTQLLQAELRWSDDEMASYLAEAESEIYQRFLGNTE